MRERQCIIVLPQKRTNSEQTHSEVNYRYNQQVYFFLAYRETPRDQGLKKSGPLRPGESEKEPIRRDWFSHPLHRQQFCGRYQSRPEREIAWPTIHKEKQRGCPLLGANKHTHKYIKYICVYILFICLRLYFRRLGPHHQSFYKL